MTDRKLLELAAKAAGYLSLGLFWDAGLGYLWDGEGVTFDPLNDDGDALRLAVKLNIGIHPDPQVAEVSTSFMVGNLGYGTNEEWGPLRDGSQDDPYRATRRAIVRAAAEIGKAMR